MIVTSAGDDAYVKKGFPIAIQGWPTISAVSREVAEWSPPYKSLATFKTDLTFDWGITPSDFIHYSLFIHMKIYFWILREF